MNASGEAARGLASSLANFLGVRGKKTAGSARSGIPPASQAITFRTNDLFLFSGNENKFRQSVNYLGNLVIS